MATLSFEIQNLFCMLGHIPVAPRLAANVSNKSRMCPIKYAGGTQKLFGVNHASGPAGSSSGVGFHWA